MTEVKRKLGLTTATFIVLGNIVGVMIFLEQGSVAKLLPWDSWFLVAWLMGGALALIGALSLAELGVMMPTAGGDYVFIREAYGERLAFLSGWTSVAITFPGSIAAMTVGICQFQGPAVFGPWVGQVALDLGFVQIKWAQFMALGLIAFITAVNHIGIKPASWLQAAITATPLALLLAFGVGALFVDPPIVLFGEKFAAVHKAADPSVLSGLFLASVPIFFAYAGWNVTTYIGGEIKDPARNIPRSLIIGTLAATGIYVVVCLVFLKGLPVEYMPRIFDVGGTALTNLFGSWAGSVFLLVIALAVLGSVNATALAGGRVSYAMAKDQLVPGPVARISPRYETPAVALWVQGVIAAIVALSGTFDDLVKYVGAVMLAFSSFAVLAVIVLRVRRPQAKREYKVLGYPVLPALYVAFSLSVVVYLLYKDPKPVLYGLLITAIGLPVFELMSRRRPAGAKE